MTVSLKKEILRLRGENKTYDEIKDLLGCSKATISYHCTRNGIGNNKPIIDNELVNQINDYYLNHTIDEVVKRFNISRSTVIRYTDNKRIKLSDRLYKKRQSLKKIIMDKKLPLEERFKAQQKLSQMPRNSAKNRVMNRCKITGRPHGVYRKLKISRIALRDLGLAGLIPGMTKSSW